jgi:hypothetical protein
MIANKKNLQTFLCRNNDFFLFPMMKELVGRLNGKLIFGQDYMMATDHIKCCNVY